MIKMYRYELFTVFDLISALVPKIAHPDRFRKTCAARLAHSSTGVWTSYIKFTRYIALKPLLMFPQKAETDTLILHENKYMTLYFGVSFKNYRDRLSIQTLN